MRHQRPQAQEFQGFFQFPGRFSMPYMNPLN